MGVVSYNALYQMQLTCQRCIKLEQVGGWGSSIEDAGGVEIMTFRIQMTKGSLYARLINNGLEYERGEKYDKMIFD